MSKYTTELRYVCEVESGLVESKGFNSIETILANSRASIFNFPYPIFDETYRPVLETKILRHYYTRELCTETVGLWKHFLSVRMNEIMPYYNKLYESETLQFNPLMDTNLTKDHSGSGTKASEYDRTDAKKFRYKIQYECFAFKLYRGFGIGKPCKHRCGNNNGKL